MEIVEWKQGYPPIPHGTTGIFSMKAADYHSDPCEKPSLSASIAKKVVTQSPYHAWLAHPKMGRSAEYAEHLDRGTLIHSLILGHDPETFAIVAADDWRTKAARSMRDSARAMGKTPVLEEQFADAQGVAIEFHDEMQARGYNLSEGLNEIVLLWVENHDGIEVQCRGMLDHLTWQNGLILDVKTCESAHPTSVQRAIYNYGYDIQSGAYSSAFRSVFPDMAGREDYLWAFIELLGDGSPRRSVIQLYRPDGMMRELGASRWKRAVAKWAQCVAENKWPQYGDGPVPITPQGWVVKEELGER